MTTETQEHSTVEVGSNRSFGFVFTTVFTLIGLLPLFNDNPVHIWSLIIAGIFFALSIATPNTLKPLNILWFKFGLLIGRFINPIVMFVIYVVAILPMGLLLKLFRKDLLSLKFDKSASSYWVKRQPPGPAPDSLKDQF